MAQRQVDDNSKKVENRRQHDSVKRPTEEIEFGEDCIAKQKCEAKCKQEPGVKQECAVAHREETVHRAKENELSHRSA